MAKKARTPLSATSTRVTKRRFAGLNNHSFPNRQSPSSKEYKNTVIPVVTGATNASDGVKPKEREGRHRGIIATDNNRTLIDNGVGAKLKGLTDINKNDYFRTDPAEDLGFDPISHWQKLQKLANKDGDEFGNNVMVRCAPEYKLADSEWYQTVFVQYKPTMEELRCTRGNLNKLLGQNKTHSIIERLDWPSAQPSALAPRQSLNKRSQNDGCIQLSIMNDDDRRIKSGRGGYRNYIEETSCKSDSDKEGDICTPDPIKNPPIENSNFAIYRADKRTTGRNSQLKPVNEYAIIVKHTRTCKKNAGAANRKPRRTALCVVQDVKTRKHTTKTWDAIEKEGLCGNIKYRDDDWGQGIHPPSDRLWMKMYTCDEKLRKEDYEIVDAIWYPHGRIDCITIFLVVKGGKKDFLTTLREEREYYYDGPVRCSLSLFTEAGGNRNEALGFVAQVQKGAEAVERLRAGKTRLRPLGPWVNIVQEVKETIQEELKVLFQHELKEILQQEMGNQIKAVKNSKGS
jgi:hypothetical protein